MGENLECHRMKQNRNDSASIKVATKENVYDVGTIP